MTKKLQDYQRALALSSSDVVNQALDQQIATPIKQVINFTAGSDAFKNQAADGMIQSPKDALAVTEELVSSARSASQQIVPNTVTNVDMDDATNDYNPETQV